MSYHQSFPSACKTPKRLNFMRALREDSFLKSYTYLHLRSRRLSICFSASCFCARTNYGLVSVKATTHLKFLLELACLKKMQVLCIFKITMIIYHFVWCELGDTILVQLRVTMVFVESFDKSKGIEKPSQKILIFSVKFH